MGATCSRPPPPPLIEVSGPRSKILVPAGSAFTFHPPEHRGRAPQILPYNPYPLSHRQPYPSPSPYTPPLEYRQRPRVGGRFPSPGPDPRAGGRYGRHNRYPGPPARGRDRGRSPSSVSSFTDRDRGEQHRPMNLGRERARRDPRTRLKPFGGRNTESTSSDMNLSEPGSPRGMGGRMRGGGMGGCGTGRGGGVHGQGIGMNSAPDLRAPMGYPGGGHPGMQQPGVHGYGGAGVLPGYGGAPQPGVGGVGIPSGGVPYGAAPGGGMGYLNPYLQQQPQPQPVPMQYVPPPPPLPPQQAQQRPRAASLSGYAAVPMGPYAMPSPFLSSPAIPRAHTDSPPAAKLNRGKPADQRAGPQGQEWIQGDPFLDACFCTTQCTCRKGHRMLYREKLDDGQTTQGEIRYLPKDLLGKDCGDHSNCNRSIETEAPRSGGGKRKGVEREDVERGNEKECRAARVEARQGIQRLNEGLVDIAAKLDEMNLKQRGSGELGNGMGMGAAAIPGKGLAPQRMQYPDRQPQMLDPMQQRMAAAGMQGMMNPRAAALGGRLIGAMGQPGMPPMGMGMDHGMPGYNEGPYGNMYEESERGMSGMMDMERRPSRGMMNGMPPNYGPPPRRGGKGRRPPRMGMDFDARGPPTRGGRGGRRAKGVGQRRDFEEDEEDDMGPMRGMGGRGGFDGEGDESWVDETEEDDMGLMGRRGSPSGRHGERGGGRGPSMGRRGPPGGGGRRAQVEDEEEDGSGI